MHMNKMRGFTLLELIITVVVAGVLFAIAAPNFQSMVQNNRASTQVNHFVTATTMARSEALRQSRPVTLCISSDQESCTGGDDWAVGWLIIEGEDGDYGDVLRSWGPASGNPSMTASTNRIAFQANGRTDMSGTVTISHRFDSCIGDQPRDIRLRATGRTVVERIDCADL